MRSYTSSDPKFSEEISVVETTDPAHADNINAAPEQLLQNTLVNKKNIEEQEKKVLFKTGDSKDNTVTFEQASIRSNITSGENHSTLFGKIKKYLFDLKAVAFSGSYSDLSNKPTIPSASSTTPKAAGTATKGSETTYARGDHVHPLQTSVSGSSGSCTGNANTATKATQDGNGNVIADTYAKKSIYGDNFISNDRRTGTTVGGNSFAFGYDLEASGGGSHAEGGHNTASNDYSHAEGQANTASGEEAHAEGYSNVASGSDAHAEGAYNTASGTAAHAEGTYNTASNDSSHVSGKYSKSMTNGAVWNTQVGDVFVIGNGTGDSTKSNALRVTYKGEVYGTQAFKSSGADYAEHIKEWADGNPDNEDRVGYMVTIKNGLLHKANAGDYIAGITSGNPSVVGNADEDYYWKYERDEFNRIVMEDVSETAQQRDEDGKPLFDKETHKPLMIETGKIIKNARMKLADNYNLSLQENYIERKDRKEWDYVGMVGIIPVRDDGTCLPDHFCKCGQNGIATLAKEQSFDTFYVIERISDNVISVELR